MDNSNTSGTTNTTASAPNNSGINKRDRDGANPTPGDQGNSQADRDLTQKIRQAIVSNANNANGTNHFSETAKNVKIITTGGKVTLRGPVNSADEKSGIESIAKGVAGDANVDDQLEVKSNP